MIGIILQARTGSTRLPGKICKRIYKDQSILEYLISHLKQVKSPHRLIVATTNSKKDLPIVEMANKCGVEFFRGSEEDVQKRFIDAAEFHNIDLIIRIPSDNPFILPSLVDEMLNLWEEDGSLDYLSNVLENTFPIGMHIEIFTLKALIKSRELSQHAACLEHVTPCIYNNSNTFKLKNYSSPIDYSNYRLTVDYEEDYLFSTKLASTLGDKIPKNIEDLIAEVDQLPELFKINNMYKKNQTRQLCCQNSA